MPMVPMAINAYEPLEYHLELGAKLAALRERGVLIVGSGNVVHNLGAMDPSQPDERFGWAQRFDDHARAQVLDDPAAAVRLQEHSDYVSAVPTPDHFIPLLYFAGLAAADSGRANVLTDGCAYGSLSMTSYTLGLPDV
jgi:4,5-DOPA dioxygenase extradiol